MITDGLDCVLESMNEVLKNYPYPEKKAGTKEKPPIIFIEKDKDKNKEEKKKD